MQVALTLNNLAALLRQMERKAQAEELYRKALAIREDALGLDHPQVQFRALNPASPWAWADSQSAMLTGRREDLGLDTAAVIYFQQTCDLHQRIEARDRWIHAVMVAGGFKKLALKGRTAPSLMVGCQQNIHPLIRFLRVA